MSRSAVKHLQDLDETLLLTQCTHSEMREGSLFEAPDSASTASLYINPDHGAPKHAVHVYILCILSELQ